MEKQALLALFFAIFWGGIMNVSGRWKMFQPVLRYPQIFKRFSLSLVVMVVLPIWYFAWQLQCVGAGNASSTREVFAAVLPALGVFVFYRFWMVIVELFPEEFYWRDAVGFPHKQLEVIDTSVERLNIGEGFTVVWNGVAGVIYGLLAVGVAWWLR